MHRCSLVLWKSLEIEFRAVKPPALMSSCDDVAKSVGLGELNIDLCDVLDQCIQQLLHFLRYKDIFSSNHLDCGEARSILHHIYLSKPRPFRLHFRRVSPSQYQKLHQILTEMEEKEIIHWSASEYATPLVLVWKNVETYAFALISIG